MTNLNHSDCDATAVTDGSLASEIVSQDTATCAKRVFSAEHRAKLSARAKQRAPRLGHRLSDEAKAKIGDANRGRVFTEEHRRKIAKASRGRAKSSETRELLRRSQTGRRYSEESRSKMSASAKARTDRAGHCQSLETRAKISAALSGTKHPRYGKKHTAETICRMKEAAKRITPETRRKLSLAQIGNKKNLGRHHSTETLLKLKTSAQLRAKNYVYRAPSAETRAKMSKSQILRLQRSNDSRYKNTKIELKMQSAFTDRGVDWVSAFASGKGVADLYLPSLNALIECDGCYWHGCPTCQRSRDVSWVAARHAKDVKRSIEMQSMGYRVFRFWEHEIRADALACVDRVLRETWSDYEI